MTHPEQRPDLLDRYWRDVARDIDAPPPDGLEPVQARVIRDLHRDMIHPAPDARFVAALRGRLTREAAAMRAADLQPPPRTRTRWNLRGGGRWPAAALASAVAAVAILAGVAGWRDQAPALSADEIIRRAQAAASPSPEGFRNFVVKETSEVRPLDAAAGEQVRSEISRWYEAPGYWRREVASTVIGADGRAVSHNGLTSVSDGDTVWIYRLRDNLVMARPSEQAPAPGELGPFPEVTGGLSNLLDQAGACYMPRVLGSDTIAGRQAYIIELGGSRCPVAEGAGDAEPVEWTLWVDKKTFLILKSVQGIDGRVLATTAVTSVQYNVPIEPARFTFIAPPGARMRDARPAPAPTQPRTPAVTP